MAALNETLRMAQQNNDQWCLLHALAMLCRLLSSCAPGAPGLPPEDLASLKHGSQPVQLLRLLRRCMGCVFLGRLLLGIACQGCHVKPP
jgi:hypothetical protein